MAEIEEEHFILKDPNGHVDDLIIERRRCCSTGCLVPQSMLNNNYMTWLLNRQTALELIEFLQRNLPKEAPEEHG